MKIIREGKLPGEREVKRTCDHCKTRFSFKEKEARFVADQRDGDALVIKCPVCKVDVWTAA